MIISKKKFLVSFKFSASYIHWENHTHIRTPNVVIIWVTTAQHKVIKMFIRIRLLKCKQSTYTTHQGDWARVTFFTQQTFPCNWVKSWIKMARKKIVASMISNETNKKLCILCEIFKWSFFFFLYLARVHLIKFSLWFFFSFCN